jgi:hypothetical protein
MKVTKQQAEKRRISDERVEDYEAAVPSEYAERPQFVGRIKDLWQDVHHRFLMIGRLLVQAKKVLPHGEFDKMVEAELPFTAGIASQLRAVAEAVDTNRLAIDEMPKTYSVAYQLTTLDDEALKKARQEGLVHPDVRRAEVIRFKKSLKDSTGLVPDPVRARRLLEHYRRLREQMRAMKEEMQALGVDPDALDDKDDGAGEGQTIEGEAMEV